MNSLKSTRSRNRSANGQWSSSRSRSSLPWARPRRRRQAGQGRFERVLGRMKDDDDSRTGAPENGNGQRNAGTADIGRRRRRRLVGCREEIRRKGRKIHMQLLLFFFLHSRSKKARWRHRFGMNFSWIRLGGWRRAQADGERIAGWSSRRLIWIKQIHRERLGFQRLLRMTDGQLVATDWNL